MIMTFEQYDKLLEKFEHVHVSTYYPTPEQIEIMEQDPERWIVYACYQYEKGGNPRNSAEKYGRKNLMKFINKHLVLVDAEESLEGFI